MTTKRILAWGTAAIAAATVAIGGAEAAGFFKEASDIQYGTEGAASASLRRSLPNGRTDIIKAMGNTRWGDIELK
jgi:hypothetical protein